MKTKKQITNKAFSLTELCRKALTVLLTIAMVSMNSPFAYAAEADAMGVETRQAAKPATSSNATSQNQESNAQATSAEESVAAVPETTQPVTEPKSTEEVAATEPAQGTAGPSEPAIQPVVDVVDTSDATAEKVVTIQLEFERAYIHYKNQVIASPTSTLDVPAGEEFSFVATADQQSKLSSVKAIVGNDETVLEPNANGLYVVPAAKVVSGLRLRVIAEGDPFAAESTTTAIEEKRNEQPTFTFEDNDIKVTATLTDPSALPEGVRFQVTPVTPQSTDYNYDAYMAALNKSSEEEGKYTRENTLLYDVAFLMPKKDANGKVVPNEWVEVQLADGLVKLDVQFKKQQLSQEIKSEGNDEVEVNHLPLTDTVRSSVDTTAKATNINADDIVVEQPKKQDANVAAENVQVSLDSLSVIGFTGHTQGEKDAIAQPAYPVTVTFTDENGNLTVPSDFDLSNYVIYAKTMIRHNQYYSEPSGMTVPLEKAAEKVYSLNGGDNVTIESACIVEVHNPNAQPSQFIESWNNNKVLQKDDFVQGWRFDCEDVGDAYRVDFKKMRKETQTVTTQFVKDDGVTLLDAMNPALTSDVYAVATFKVPGNDDGIAGWAIKPIAKEAINNARQATVTFDTITLCNDNGDPTGSTSPYYPDLYDIDVMLYTNPNKAITTYKEAVNESDRFIPGYDFVSNKKLNEDPLTTVIKLEQPMAKSYVVHVNVDEGVNISAGDNYYLCIRLDHRTTEDSYQLIKLNPSAGSTSTLQIANTWFDKSGNAKEDVFSGNEGVKLAVLSSNSPNLRLADVLDGDGNVKGNSSSFKYLGLQSQNGVTAEYGVLSSSTVDGVKSFEQSVRICGSEIGTAQNDGISLNSVLGNARYFGYVANRWYVNNDAETNAAVKEISSPGHQSGIAGGGKVAYESGDHIQPWYIGSVVGPNRQMIKSDKAVLYAPIEARRLIYHEGEVNQAYEGSTDKIEYHPMSQADVNAYIDAMMSNVISKSNEMLSKNTYPGGVGSMMQSQKIQLDVTSRGAGTVYVDLDQPVTNQHTLMDYAFGLGDCKLIITKNSDQTIVFNSSQADVILGKYEIHNKYSDRTVNTASDTMLNGNSQDFEDIAKTIIFNLPNAKNVKTAMSVSGIVIAPQAKVVVSSTSAGWLVADSINNTSGEWHAIWMHYNPNYDKAVAQVVAHKQLQGATLGDKQFHFELKENDTLVQTAANDADGNIVFNLSYGSAGTHHYTIREVNDTQSGITYDDHAVNVTVTVDEQMRTTVTYENNAEPTFTNTTSETTTGELTVTKTVANPQDGDATKEFNFTVTLTNPVASGEYSVKNSDEKVNFNAQGQATFTLKSGESKTITGLPIGVHYEVSETADNDFTTTSTGKSGNISGTAATASFTNTRKQYGGLKIQKVVTENGHAPATAYAKSKLAGTYTFKIYKDAACTQAVNDGNGPRTVSITIGNDGAAVTSDEVTNLEAGNYWVKEDNPTNGLPGVAAVPVTVQANKTGNEAVTATVTNNFQYETSDLEVKKTITSVVNGDTSQSFRFRVTLTSTPAISGTYGGTTFNDNVAEFDLTPEQTCSATGLPAGTHYKVEELLTDEQKAEFNEQQAVEGNTSASNTARVTVNNTRKNGSLTINKAVVSPVPADSTRSYEFAITLDKPGVNGTFQTNVEGKTVSFANSATTSNVEVAGNDSITIVGLPANVGYTVTETEESSQASVYTVGKENANGTIPVNAAATATFTNTRKTGDITVSKQVVSESDADKDKAYSFALRLTTPGISGEFETSKEGAKAVFANSETTVSVKGNEQLTIHGLPVGVGYVVEEAAESSNGYSVSSNGASGTINTGNSQANFTNTKVSGLVISKSVVSSVPADLTKDYSFKVKLGGEDFNHTFGEGADAVTFSKGEATITVRGGASKVITGIPADTSYEITEVPDNDFISEVTEGSTAGTIEAGKTSSVAFKNTRKEGKLKISKSVVSDVPADVNANYSFEIELNGTNVNGTFRTQSGNEVTFADGKATLDVQGGADETILGLPAGVGYTVTEATQTNFNVDSENTGGSIAAGGTAEAKFTNTRKTGKIKIEKALVSSVAADKETDYQFEIQLLSANMPLGITKTYRTTDNEDVAFASGKAKVTIHGAGSKTIEGLPANVNYAVTEVGENGPLAVFNVGKENANGTIKSGDEVATAKFTNNRKTGELTVSKSVSSNDDNDKQIEFEFTVTLKSAVEGTFNVKGSNEKVTFDSNGKTTFKLKSGESKTIEGLPLGIGYEVTEKAVDDFTTVASNNDGTIAATNNVEFTNTRVEKGELVVSKSVTSDVAADHSAQYNFTVQLTPPVEGTFDGMTFNSDGVATFTLADGQSKRATGLPAGTNYTVTESLDGNEFKSIANDNAVRSGTISDRATANEQFVNYRETGSLTIRKSVVTAIPAEENATYTFVVTLGEGINKTFGTGDDAVTFENGIATVTVVGGQAKTITGLPKDVSYTVEERVPDNMTAEVPDNASGTIGDNTGEVAFRNTHKTTSLKISKAVVSDVAADHANDYKFTVRLGDDTINGTFSGVTFTKGVAQNVTVVGDQERLIEGLPVGVTYTVKESEEYATRFETTPRDATAGGTLVADSQAHAAFSNTRRTGDLVVSKSVTSNTPADHTKQFTFTVTLKNNPLEGTKTFGEGDAAVTFENNTTSFTLADGQSKRISGLPVDVEYEVTESDNDGFTTTYTGATGTIKTAESKAEFRNARSEGDLTISKQVISKIAADQNKVYKFDISLEPKVSGTYDGVTFTDGVATGVEVQGGKSRTIAGLPKDTTYTVTEAQEEGSLLSVAPAQATGTVGNAGTATATFTNTHVEGSLSVTKTVASTTEADKTTQFHFEVTLNEPLNGLFGDEATGMEFHNGVAEFDLSNGQTRTATGLPAGITYEVTETSNDGYNTTSENAKGTIAANTLAAASFVNTRKEGKLEVLKTVVNGIASDSDTDFRISVDLHDPNLNNTYGTGDNATQFTAGVATFSLKDGAKRTIEGLPIGTTYTVSEQANGDFLTTYEGNVNDAITENATNHVTVKNTRQYGALKIKKNVQVNEETTTSQVADGTYVFTITGPNGYSQTRQLQVVNGASAEITLDNLVSGEYAITERADPRPNLKPIEGAEQRVTVNVGETATVPTATFDNDLKTTSATLAAAKSFNNWNSETAQVKSFTFRLTPKNGAPMPATGVLNDMVAKTVENANAVEFGGITYTAPGVFEYEIQEVVPEGYTTTQDGKKVYKGVTYDDTIHTAKVTVTADGQGGLSKPEVVYDQNEENLVIENKYDAAGNTNLSGTKAIDGRQFQQGDKWKFTVAQPAGQNAPMPANTEVVIDAFANGGNIDFGSIEGFGLKDVGQTYTYTITESNVDEDGVSDIVNDSAKVVTVHVVDNGDGTLGFEKSTDQQPLMFTNTYVISEDLVAKKGISNRDWKKNELGEIAETYEFELIDAGQTQDDVNRSAARRRADNVKQEAKTSGQDHEASFGTFKFTCADAGNTYSYTVREKIPADAVEEKDENGNTIHVKDGIVYTEVVYDVTFEVVRDQQTGNLSVKKTFKHGNQTEDGLKFLNVYRAKKTNATISAQKVLEGRAAKEGEFKFELYFRNSEGKLSLAQAAKAATHAQGQSYDAAAKRDNLSVTFDTIECGVVGTETYFIKEVVPEGAVANDNGTYTKDGVTYDPTPREVRIVTTDDDKNGQLKAQVVYVDSENNNPHAITNTYFGVQAAPAIQKEYYGTDQNAKFGFTMTATDKDFKARVAEGGSQTIKAEMVTTETPLVDDGQRAFSVTTTNAAFQDNVASVQMPAITYHKAGTYYYVISENVADNDAKLSADAAKVRVTVTVTESGTSSIAYQLEHDGVVEDVTPGTQPTLYNNALVAMSMRSRALRAMSDSTAFTNFEPAVKKVLKSGVLKGGDFSFSMYAGDGVNGDALQTTYNDVNGVASFGSIRYDTSDIGKTYTYTIVENNTGDEAIVYDTDHIKVEVKVDKGENGAVVANATYTKLDVDGKQVTTDAPDTFVNSYENIVIHTIKRSREEPYDPLPGAHYGLWMINPDGENVYMGLGRNQAEAEGSELVSSDTGDLYYDIPMIEGVAYYFLEEWPPPAGHLVDPYPTDLFTLVHDKETGAFRFVYELDESFSTYCPGITYDMAKGGKE